MRNWLQNKTPASISSQYDPAAWRLLLNKQIHYSDQGAEGSLGFSPPSVESRYNSAFSLTQTSVASTPPPQIWSRQSMMDREQKAVLPRRTKGHNLRCWEQKVTAIIRLCTLDRLTKAAGRAAKSPRIEGGAVIYCCGVAFRLTFCHFTNCTFERLSGRTPSGALAHIQIVIVQLLRI